MHRHGQLGQGQRRFPRKETLVAIYSRVVNAETRLGEVLARDFPWCEGDSDGVRQIFEAYTGRKREGNVLDYDDLFLYDRELRTLQRASVWGDGSQMAREALYWSLSGNGRYLAFSSWSVFQ